MNKYECLYCGNQFVPRIYFEYEDICCPTCGDKNLKEIKAYKTDIFGYNEEK